MRLGTLTVLFIPLLMALGLAAGGCTTPSDHTSQFHNLPDGVWLYGDSLHFAPEHYNSLCDGDFVVAVRHDTSYPYTELWLEFTSSDHKNRIRRDTLCFNFVDHHGNWVGNGIGTSFQLADTVRGFRHPTGVEVAIRHIMRTDTLHGINQVGVFFVPKEQPIN